jgi:tRNA threonylcarbamoyl adenosine modification protein (Sua5/YciO/YrdC/YwlC family)
MLVKIYTENPNPKTISHVAEVLRADGVIIYPTDGVYAYGCSIRSVKGIERLKKIKGKSETEFSIMCADLARIADYAKVDTPTFKMLKRNLPGAFTFILRASNRVPERVMARRKTIGVRIADNTIAGAIVRELGVPLVTSSVKEWDDVAEYMTDPELIQEKWGGEVDMVIDGGLGSNVPTTLVEAVEEGEVVILRQGGGVLEQ